jgi:hypothetical protein
VDKFAILIDELGTLIQVPLQLDHRRHCALSINGELHIQMSEEETKETLLIATFIGEVPPGKFREILFKEALKENNLFPRVGTFSYSERNNQLAFVSSLPFAGLHGNALTDFLETFIEKALSWKTGLATGQLPQRGQILQKTGPSIFDVQRKS